MAEETVLTSRRALLRGAGRRWSSGRLRVSDQTIRFTPRDGAVVEVPLAALLAVRVARLPRRSLVLETATGPIRLRCFAVPAVAALLQ